MAATVFARPDDLLRFGGAAADAADDLVLRSTALAAAVGPYVRATERAYEAPCEAAPDAVRAYATALAGLGGWVGRVGSAFRDAAWAFGGLRVASPDGLLAALPPGLHLGADLPPAGALLAAEVIASGAHPRDLRALSLFLGPASPTGSRLAGFAETPAGRSIGRFLDWGAALARGASASEERWRAEPDRSLLPRPGRAAVDGALNTAGAYGGSAVGAAAMAFACAPLGPPVEAACAGAGARAGSAAGGALGELAGDIILGPEPTVVARVVDPVAVTTLQVEATTARAAAQAGDRADFVLERPWLWDDEFADAPAVAAPPPVDAPAPRQGPR